MLAARFDRARRLAWITAAPITITTPTATALVAAALIAAVLLRLPLRIALLLRPLWIAAVLLGLPLLLGLALLLRTDVAAAGWRCCCGGRCCCGDVAAAADAAVGAGVAAAAGVAVGLALLHADAPSDKRTGCSDFGRGRSVRRSLRRAVAVWSSGASVAPPALQRASRCRGSPVHRRHVAADACACAVRSRLGGPAALGCAGTHRAASSLHRSPPSGGSSQPSSTARRAGSRHAILCASCAISASIASCGFALWIATAVCHDSTVCARRAARFAPREIGLQRQPSCARACRRSAAATSTGAASPLPSATRTGSVGSWRLAGELLAELRDALGARRVGIDDGAAAAEPHALAAAADRRQQLLGRRRAQHEQRARGRLLERLEQRVGRGRRHRGRFLDDEHAHVGFVRRQADARRSPGCARSRSARCSPRLRARASRRRGGCRR